MSGWDDVLTGYTYCVDLKLPKYQSQSNLDERPKYQDPCNLEIKKIIFNGPATIVLWSDGTKTVVKCSENEEFDPEKGVAMAIWKKFLPKQYGKKASKFFEYDPKTDSRSCHNCKHFRSFKPFTNIPFTGDQVI